MYNSTMSCAQFQYLTEHMSACTQFLLNTSSEWQLYVPFKCGAEMCHANDSGGNDTVTMTSTGKTELELLQLLFIRTPHKYAIKHMTCILHV